jgi:hypothetical protein
VQETPGGENRGGDRRGGDRRKVDRRSPPPVWRRSWALVAYGVIGSLLIVALVSAALGDGEEDQSDLAAAKDSTDIVAAPAPVAVEAPPPPSPDAAPEAAMGTEDFERLSLQGDAALGRVVRAQLFCEAPSPVALVEGADTIPAQLVPLVDAERRVPAAVCWWGRRDDPRREEFLLVVPPTRAAEFSSAPVVMDGYVRRRHLIAHVQWMGKTRALALRTAGVFQGLGPPQQQS